MVRVVKEIFFINKNCYVDVIVDFSFGSKVIVIQDGLDQILFKLV